MINEINIKNIYQTVIDLEGPKYPLDNMEELNAAADYILDKLHEYGIKTEIQEFYVKGFDEPFKNVIGLIGDQSKPAVVLGSHYDTVRDCPGANDNLSAVAVSLEVARVLSKIKNPPTVIIAAFTLEEKHPGLNKALEDELIKNNIHDENHNFIDPSILKFNKKVKSLAFPKIRSLVQDNLIFKEIKDELGNTITKDEIKYLDILYNVYSRFVSEFTNNNLTYSLGSQEFVRRVKEDNIKINSIINFDCLGWISQSEKSQKVLPISKEIASIVQLNKTSIGSTVGNYIGVMGDKFSQPILNEFLNNCKSEEIDIPYFGLSIPLDYEAIKSVMMDTLRSDHAPFWQAKIPGIFISDTANFRSNYYHTGADTAKLIDYEMLTKIAKASLKTLLSYKY